MTRCECKTPKPEDVSPSLTICTKCAGWFSMRVANAEDWAKVKELLGLNDAKDD